jgi:hypothetical protein
MTRSNTKLFTLIEELERKSFDELIVWVKEILKDKSELLNSSRQLPFEFLISIYNESEKYSKYQLQSNLKKSVFSLLQEFNPKLDIEDSQYLSFIIFLVGTWKIISAYKLLLQWIKEKKYLNRYHLDSSKREDMHLFILRNIVDFRPDNDKDMKAILENCMKKQYSNHYPYHFALCYRQLCKINTSNIPRYFDRFLELGYEGYLSFPSEMKALIRLFPDEFEVFFKAYNQRDSGKILFLSVALRLIGYQAFYDHIKDFISNDTIIYELDNAAELRILELLHKFIYKKDYDYDVNPDKNYLNNHVKHIHELCLKRKYFFKESMIREAILNYFRIITCHTHIKCPAALDSNTLDLRINKLVTIYTNSIIPSAFYSAIDDIYSDRLEKEFSHYREIPIVEQYSEMVRHL